MLSLLKNFKDYGLGDTQYLEIIQNYRKRNKTKLFNIGGHYDKTIRRQKDRYKCKSF